MYTMMRWPWSLLRLLTVILWALFDAGHTISAQEETPPALTVTIRDVHGQGLPHVVIRIHDRSGQVVLSQLETDQDGQVRFATLPTSDIRVSVTGALPDGRMLQQIGQDSQGIPLVVSGPTQLDLRSDADGLVLPDPQSMLALEPGPAIDDVPIATAILALPRTQPTNVPITVPTAVVTARPERRAESPSFWLAGVALLSVLLLVLVGLLVLRQRWIVKG